MNGYRGITWSGWASAAWYLLRGLVVAPADDQDRCVMGSVVAPAVWCPRAAIADGIWCAKHGDDHCSKCGKRTYRDPNAVTVLHQQGTDYFHAACAPPTGGLVDRSHAAYERDPEEAFVPRPDTEPHEHWKGIDRGDCPQCEAIYPSVDCARCEDEAIEAGLLSPWARWFVICPSCGNKRCPKATDHRLDCTRSNEPGQPGSRYVSAALAAGSETPLLTPDEETPVEP